MAICRAGPGLGQHRSIGAGMAFTRARLALVGAMVDLAAARAVLSDMWFRDVLSAILHRGAGLRRKFREAN